MKKALLINTIFTRWLVNELVKCFYKTSHCCTQPKTITFAIQKIAVILAKKDVSIVFDMKKVHSFISSRVQQLPNLKGWKLNGCSL